MSRFIFRLENYMIPDMYVITIGTLQIKDIFKSSEDTNINDCNNNSNNIPDLVFKSADPSFKGPKVNLEKTDHLTITLSDIISN